ncbi:MAG: EamA family transporter [Desulfobacterales bacterium CG23_combo_of_CG06-09_8_20_14_all_52_9]|nr:MAG: EamA family transporter [Desulfobacterales bacterium CG23_combo_of_CG06-09_8_20_14_all_52_9]
MKKPIAGTAAGILAIVLWSTTVALVRSLTEQLGPLTAAASVYIVGGLASGVRFLLSPGHLKSLFQLPRKYLFGCGALFILYMTALFAAIGFSKDRIQVLEVGLLNYLWPPLTIIFSLGLLNRRANWILIPGTLLAVTGMAIILAGEETLSWESLIKNFFENPVAYLLGLTAAVSWALYSNLTRRWAGGHPEGAVDLFMPVTGCVFLAFSLTLESMPGYTQRAVLETVFLGLATYLGYGLWDYAMRQGEVVLVAACSYLTPLLSTLISVFYLRVSPTQGLWIGCALLVTGSLLSWFSVEATK